MINAVFNHRNFWDMRAQDISTASPVRRPRPRRVPLHRREREPRAGRDQHPAVEPGVAGGRPAHEPFEMSADGRPFPIVGRELTLELRRRHRFQAGVCVVPYPSRASSCAATTACSGLQSLAAAGVERDLRDFDSPAFKPGGGIGQLIRVAEDGTTTVVTGQTATPDRRVPANGVQLLALLGLAVRSTSPRWCPTTPRSIAFWQIRRQRAAGDAERVVRSSSI